MGKLINRRLSALIRHLIQAKLTTLTSLDHYKFRLNYSCRRQVFGPYTALVLWPISLLLHIQAIYSVSQTHSGVHSNITWVLSVES